MNCCARLRFPPNPVARAGVAAGALAVAAWNVGHARAWTSSGRTNDQLVDNLKRDGVIQSPEVEAALRSLDRRKYVVGTSSAYSDSPQLIGHGVTISAPHMHGHALERLHPKLRQGGRALDVGAGSGYLTAALALLAGSQGRCFGLERIQELVDFAQTNIEADVGPEVAKQIQLSTGDGWKGWPSEAPFDVIHVGAAAEEIPEALVEQLARGGRMIIPVGTGSQYLLEVDKDDDGSITKRTLMGVRYVPLVREKKNNIGPELF